MSGHTRAQRQPDQRAPRQHKEGQHRQVDQLPAGFASEPEQFINCPELSEATVTPPKTIMSLMP
jgi:hypothetical protein